MLARWFALPFPVVAMLVFAGACGDDGGGDDAPADAFVIDGFDNASCGDQVRLTGELVDWDTDASFCGIFEATLDVQPDGATDSTAPNGRYDLCTPDQVATQLVVTLPAAASECSVPMSGYSTPTLVYARKDVILSGGFYSARTITDARKPSFYTDLVGAPFDATKGQVFVHVHGAARPVSIEASHGTALAIAATAWAPGTTGHDVLFPNVDVGAGATMLTVEGGAIGTGTIPVVAGTITNVTVNAR